MFMTPLIGLACFAMIMRRAGSAACTISRASPPVSVAIAAGMR